MRTPQFIRANGLDFGYLEAGQRGQPLLLCAHGFPDTAHSFEPVLDRLGAAGFHVVAPFMRGYGPSAIPADGDYRVATLGRDLLALIDDLGARQAVLVGHDWGAVAAYAAAALRPDRVRALVAAAVPHLRRFLLRPTLAQLRRSSYMARFQWPGAETTLARDDFAKLRALAQSWSPGADLAPLLAPVIAGFRDRARLSAALGYYRALPGALFSGETWSSLMAPISVPTLAIAGVDDGCIAPEMFAAQQHLFSDRYALVTLAHAGHFMAYEQPQLFSTAALDFLATLG